MNDKQFALIISLLSLIFKCCLELMVRLTSSKFPEKATEEFTELINAYQKDL